jgi:hypothetical protein
MLDELKMEDKVKALLDSYKLSDLLARYIQYAILTLSYRECGDSLPG